MNSDDDNYDDNIDIFFKELAKNERAITYFERAANEGDLDAMCDMGMIYRHIDSKIAKGWLEKSAEQGHLESQYNLSRLIRHEEKYGRMIPMALKWLNKAAKGGHAESQFSLGEFYDYTIKDYEYAMKWYMMAFSQGHLLVQSHIAFMYMNGRGVEKSEIESNKWFDLYDENRKTIRK